MMTDAMKPLGLSERQLTTPRPMYVAAGRLFVDVAPDLASSARRAGLLEVMGKSDPLVGGRAGDVLGRDDFIPTPQRQRTPASAPGGRRRTSCPFETDPAVVTGLIERSEASIAKLKGDIGQQVRLTLVDFILADIEELRRILFDPQSHQVFMSAMEATWWLNEKLQAWLGENNAADILTQSVPHNVTSEMGLALLEVADVIRPHQDVVAFLQHVEDEGFLNDLPGVEGGFEAREAIDAYLDRYGMRCVGEIDITRPRWSERPTTHTRSLILGNIKNFEPGAGEQRFQQGRQEAWTKERGCLEHVRALPDGSRKLKRSSGGSTASGLSSGTGSTRSTAWSAATSSTSWPFWKEAERLVRAVCLRDKGTFLSLVPRAPRRRAYQTGADDQLISRRKDEFESYESLTPAAGVHVGVERSSPRRTKRTTCRPERWSVCRFQPGPSRAGPASSWTWRRRMSNRATSWSRPIRTQAGRPCSSPSAHWSPRSAA